MECPSCQRANPPENAFCGGCGSSLASASSDGEPRTTANPPQSYTPEHLSRGVLASRSALQGERKRVTVLFADIKNSTRLAGDLDPEEWHRILDRFFSILTEAVHHHAGTVNQYTGDGIMALFGAPLAQDEHARRACEAALAIQSGLQGYEAELSRGGLALGVRMGLNTGEVVVGKIGDELRMDYTAQGQTVGLAARAEETAGAGAIHLTANTAVQVEGYFDVDSLGPFELRGAAQPIELFALRGRAAHRTRLDLAKARGLAPLVGRVLELEELRLALREAAATRAQVVGVVGSPGAGKSRLCLQMTEEAQAAGFESCIVDCPPHGASLPFAAAQALLGSLVGLAPGTAHDPAARSVVESSLERLGGSVGELLPWVEELLEMPRNTQHRLQLDADRRRERFGAVLRQLVQADRGAPLLVWIDDAQWLDDESQRVMGGFIDALGWTPTLLLVAHRPELAADWPSVSYRHELHLGPLTPGDAAELLRSWLGEDPEVAGLVAPILEATSGNPFFVEEIVRDLVRCGGLVGERGAHRLGLPLGEIAIPSSVQDVIAARIDALPEDGKQVVQLASVVGQPVARAVLERVAASEGLDLESMLPLLDRMELLRTGGNEHGDEESALHFEHALTREVAYATQLRDVRQVRHAEIARAIETLNAAHLGPHAGLIAHHWEAAGNRPRAGRWRQRAAMQVSQIQVRRVDQPGATALGRHPSERDPKA